MYDGILLLLPRGRRKRRRRRMKIICVVSFLTLLFSYRNKIVEVLSKEATNMIIVVLFYCSLYNHHSPLHPPFLVIVEGI